MATWVPFHYREFYDVPRMLVFEHQRQTYLLDCQFSQLLDEYSSLYDVLVLAVDSDGARRLRDWGELRGCATRTLGQVAVRAVRFDPSVRREVDVDSIVPIAEGWRA